jgi:H+/Cl- antiporter ClcA
MPTDSNLTVHEANEATIPTSRLWFGSAASTAAWFSVGLGDLFILWHTCMNGEPFGAQSSHPGARVLFFLVTFLLMALAAIAGIMSYANWKRLSGVTSLLCAEANGRKEFMAWAGLYISFTLGVGIVWLCLPLFIIQMCSRAR